MKVVLILANSSDPDEMQLNAAFHLGLHCLPRYTLSSNTKGSTYLGMELSIFHFKGSQVEFSKLWCISVPEQ